MLSTVTPMLKSGVKGGERLAGLTGLLHNEEKHPHIHLFTWPG